MPLLPRNKKSVRCHWMAVTNFRKMGNIDRVGFQT
jgi:hypothetical protein